MGTAQFGIKDGMGVPGYSSRVFPRARGNTQKDRPGVPPNPTFLRRDM